MPGRDHPAVIPGGFITLSTLFRTLPLPVVSAFQLLPNLFPTCSQFIDNDLQTFQPTFLQSSSKHCFRSLPTCFQHQSNLLSTVQHSDISLATTRQAAARAGNCAYLSLQLACLPV